MKLLVLSPVVPSLLVGEERQAMMVNIIKRAQERYNLAKDPDTELVWSFPERGVGAMEQNFQEELGATYVMKQILEVDENVYDGVIVLCGLDPCLVAAREYLKIPVVGMLSTGVNLASILGRKFSIVTPRSSGMRYEEMDLIRAYSMEAKLASIRGTATALTNFDTLSPEQALEEIIIEARKAIDEDGADVILLGCGAMEGFEMLTEKLGVPVIDMGFAALKMCELIVKLGLSHSKVAYPYPSEAIPANVFD